VLPKSLIPRHRPQRGASAATVSIHVRNLAQMFNSLDPSPFWDRDLDRDAAEFIEEDLSEKLSATTWHLHHVCTQEGGALAADLQATVEHYYERLANSARYRLRDEMRRGQLALLSGLGIFLVSMTIRSILTGLIEGGAPRVLDEGLIIIAWLALWRPTEWLLYGWVPLRRKRWLYERLAAIPVSVRTEAAHSEGACTEAAAAVGPAAGTVTIPQEVVTMGVRQRPQVRPQG
jgi:hypothetical protein